jgi:Bacterial Ig-like domain (group 3)
MIAKRWLIALTSLLTPSVFASTQAHLVQSVLQAPTNTSVQSPAGLALAATGVSLAIHVVSPNGLVVPDGTVVVSDGAIVMDSVPVINGTATLTSALSSVGVHQLVACYSGDSNFSPSCSSSLNLTALAPYTLQQSNPSAVIESSTSFTDRLNVIPAKGFVGVVQLVCQVPSDQCELSPSSVSFSGDGKSQVVKASFIPSPLPPAISFIALPLIGLIGRQIRRKSNQPPTLAFLVTAIMVLGLAGCGPIVKIPFNSTNFTMRVDATSGAYSQAVMYQIQVNTDIVQQ